MLRWLDSFIWCSSAIIYVWNVSHLQRVCCRDDIEFQFSLQFTFQWSFIRFHYLALYTHEYKLVMVVGRFSLSIYTHWFGFISFYCASSAISVGVWLCRFRMAISIKSFICHLNKFLVVFRFINMFRKITANVILCKNFYHDFAYYILLKCPIKLQITTNLYNESLCKNDWIFPQRNRKNGKKPTLRFFH